MDLHITNTVNSGTSSHSEPGYGLKGMIERAERAGGTVATSLTAGSFDVELSLPYQEGVH